MAADVEGVQRLLEELHRHSKENFPDSEINDPAALVEQLRIAVLALDPRSPADEADVALFSSFVFESRVPRDLLSFVMDTTNTSPQVTKKARMAALKAVGDFVKRLKGTPNVDRYAMRIKDGVWAVFSKETMTDEVKSRALRPLRELLKLRPPSLAADRWDVPGMWASIKEQYRLGSSKISAGVKGELLKLAGSLLLVYGRDVPELAEGADTMLGWCDTALQNDTKNKQLGKAQALQPAVVAGALACIDLACSAGFEERYTYTAGESATKPNTKLYMFLLRAAHEGSADGLSRFEVPAKALRFFRRHANLFSDNVGSLARALQLFNIMEKCSTAGGKSSRLKLKKHALPAIEAILREVAKYIASKPQRKDTLDRLEGTFLKLLESAKPTTEETTIGLAGIAALSPAATALSSYQEAADVTDRLLVCLDSARGRLDTVGFADEDGDSEEENAGDEEISGTSGGEAGAAVLRKGISLKVEAQFLRTLACRAGVLGGVFAREDAASAGVAAMDISGGTNDVTEKRGAGAAGVGGSVPGHVMRRLQTLALRLVERYALLSERDRGLTCRGLCQLCLAFCGPGQGDNLSRMLGVVVQKGVSLAGTMENPGGGFDDAGEPNSAPVRWVAPVDPITGAVDARLCFLYADLWRRVMNPGTEELEPLQAWGGATAVSIIYGDSVTPEVYDAVLGAVLTAIKRLDLRYTYGTPEEGGRPIPLHPTDQNMFLNLVSFCQDLLPTCRPDLLQEWVPILCPELVKRSLERPLVSGFYRLVTVVFKETARTGYFDDGPLSPPAAASDEVVSSPSGSTPAAAAGAQSTGGVVTGAHTSKAVGRGNEASAEGSGGDGGRLACRRVLCRYLDWMTVRLGGFRDELLAACTEALLSAPVGLLGGDLGPLVPALKVALTSGASHLPTAAIAVGALERWEEETPALLRPHLDEILPHLDRHLSGGGGGGDGRSAEKARRSKGGKAGSSATRKKGAAGAGAGGEDASGEEIRRKDLRRRIGRFLGRLGGRNHVVAGDASQALSNSLAWDTKPRIVLGVPFQGQQRPLSICLDGVLQRLVELALHEGARQTKTLAAECLHALVVYMVGCTATDPSSGQQGRPGDFSKLFRRVFPAVLRLAVDLDETTRTLFSKLSMQLVRWFSQAQTDNDDTLALLDCLGEGAAAEEGGPLREVCAKGVVEFLRYAIKQSTKRQQAEGPVAVDALLTRVFALATHPDKNRRLGGLMAFNQLCRPLREETALLDRYALRLLHVALISLRRAHHDHSALGVADAASSAVDRALRMVHESVAHKGDRADLLREKDGRGELRSVQQMAAWAWDQIGALETRFRRKCMTVLLALCPLVVEASSDSDDPNAPYPSDNEGTRAWVWLRLKESGRGGVSEAVRVFESSVSQGRATHFLAAGVADGGSGSALEVEGGDPSAKGAAGCGDGEDEQRYDADKSEWDQIATSADCYNFARETGIITAGELFLGKTEEDGSSSSSRGKSGASQGEERAFSKKRKASSTAGAGDDVGTTTRTTRPHVLRSLAGAMERFGAFLEDFSFQTLVGEEGGEEAFPDAEIAQGIGSRRLASTSTSGRMSTGATVAGASAGRPLLVDDPGLLPTEQAAAQLSRAVLLRRGFTLLAGCLSDDGGGSKDDTRGSGPSGDEMAALLVKEGLWSRRAQLVLIYSLVWPWAGGLLPRASDGDEVEQFLPAAAERLLKHWKTLDRAARPGNEFSKTLRDLLQVRVFKDVGTRASAGDGGGTGCFGTFDLCQWILSQSLSSQEALSRPFLVVRAGRTAAPSSATADTAGGAPGERSAGGDARRLQHRHRSRRVPQPPDDELTGRVIRAYRSFANAGIFGSVSDGDSLRLATGLWSTVLRLPEGLRPASEHRANTALRLAIDLGLPTTGGTAVVDGSSKTASILASLLDVRPAKRASAAAGRGAGATQGALFYRRFSEPVHEAMLKRGAGCPWPALCKSLVDACLSTNTTDTGAAGVRDGGRHPLLAAQAFSILEGVLTLQSEQQRVRAAALLSPRVVTTRMMDPGETLEAIVPEFRRLVDDPDWGPPPPPTANAPSPAPKKKAREGEGSSATAAVGPGGRMLRESLRLCHRLLRLAAAVQSTGAYTAKKAVGKGSPSSSTRSCFNQLLEMSAVLVAGTLGSASPAVDASAKADALTLVPFLRPCLTRKARDYGHSPATPSASGGQRDGNATGAGAGIVLPALEEMVARHFPIENSHEPEEGSEQATTFARLLRGLLAAFVRCGDLGLLELLFGSLAEGRKHLHYSWVSRALDAFVSGLDVERDGVAEAVFGFCLDKVASNRVAASTKATLFDKVCLPMVRRCPVEVSRKLYLSVSPDAGSGFKPISSEGGDDGAKEGVPVLKRLLAVVGRRSDEKLFKDKALLASCCLLLIEALYDMLDLADLQSLADEAFAKKDALKEVTTGIVKAWKAVCRFKRRYDLPWLELRCRRAAFCCVCTVVRSTQTEQKWFNNLVWADSLYDKASSGGAAAVADKTSVLALVLDMEKEHKFEVTPPFFRTSPLVPARPPPFGGGEGGPHGGASGRGRRRGMTASAMLSQSSLAFGGDSLAGGAEQVSDNGNGVGGGGGGNAAAEDVRETYSSQAALAEPGGVLDGDDGGAGTASQSTQYESQSQGDMAPVFGAGAMEVSGGRGRGVASTEDKEEVLVLEESHLNKEQCMRSLLLVVQTEDRLFGDSWQDALKQSGGAFEPAWSSKMRAKLADIDLPRNIRLLAFQFAMNAPVSGLLVPWAVPWIRAMADFALAPLPEGLRVDGEKGLHYLLRDFMQLLLDESSTGGGWGGVVREARAEERREAEAAGDGPGDVSRQPLLGVGNRLVSHLMSVSSHPDGKTAMLRANVMLVAGLVGLFGDVFVEVGDETTADGHRGGGGQDDLLLVEGHQMGRRNDLQRLNLQYVVDMLKEREGHTGGAHASTKSTGVQAKHTILTGLNLLGVLLGRRVPVFVESAGPAANELARTLPDVCLSYSQKNAFETGAELLAMALAHVKWLRDGGGLPPEDDLCAALRGGAGTPSGSEGGADGEWLVRRVTDRLMRMGKDGKLRSRFVHAVAAIARVYPAVLTRKLLLESLRAMQFAEAACRGRFLAMLADNIPSGQVPDLEVQDLFTILQPHLPSLLLEPDVEFVRGSKETGQESEWVPMAQLSALRLLRALTKTMTSKQLGAVLGEDDAHSLMGLATPSTYRGCREIAYAALLDLHVAARESTASSKQGRSPEQDEDARGGAGLTSAQREAVRCALLRGLSDPDDEGMAFDDKAASDEATTAHTTDDSNDPSRRYQQHPRRGIRRSLLNVFDAPPSEGGGGLEEDPGRRMLALMRDMFDARTARAWLRFAPYLLLRPAEKAPGYKDVLFKKSLSSCEFVDMPVVGGGGGFEARPMEPAFSFASLSSQQSQDAAGGASYGGGGGGGGSYGTLTTDVDVRGAGRLRATQDYLWAATQGAGGGVGAGKEPGARAGPAGVRTSHVAFPSQTQGKMLGVSYAGSQAVMPPPPPRAQGTGGKEPRSSQGGVGRRFWRTSGGSMSSMTKGETLGIQRRMAAKRARDKATRTKRAVIYRKYRDGELPDIMIKLGDVLRPLQHLSMLDGGIAREVFVQIFKEVYSGLEGTARAPIAAAPLPSDDGGDNGCTPEELENEIRREAAGGEGRRAVAVLLQKMLSSARHDTDVVACLHAACRATSTAAANPLGSTGGDGGRSGPSPSSSASSSALQDRRHVGQQQRAGSHLIGAASRSSSSSSSTVVPRGRARNSKQQQQEAGRDAPGGTGAGTAAEEGDAISLSPNLVASTALSSLNIHSGILLLEDSIMRTGRERAAADASVDASGAASVGGGQQQRRRRGAKAAQETHGKANVVVDVEKGQQDSWLQLSKLYAALGERDALVGVAARASKSEETRHALEAELSGDYESALEIYRKLMDRYDTRYEKDDFDSQHSARGMEKGEEMPGAQKDDNVVVASEAELRAWDMHQLECMRQLGQWKELQGEVVSMLSEYDDEGETADSAQFGGEDERGSAECQRRVWGAEPSRRDDLLPFFVWSIVHDHRRSEIALSAFLDAIVDPAAPPLQLADSAWEGQGASAAGAGAGAAEGAIAPSSPHGSSSSSCTRLAWLEKNMPGELAKAFLLGGRLGRAHQCVARCYDRFQEKWAGLHSCADSARRDQLRGLQLVVEVEDFLAFHDQKATAAGAAGGLPGRVSGLLDRWSRQSPSDTLDPVTSWSAIIAHRRDCFTAIEGDLEQVELSSQPQGLDCRRDMLQHTADLSLVAAGAAIRQGVKKVAQQLINSYTRLKKKAGGLSPTDKQPQTLQTQGTAAQGEDLRLALIKVDFNAAKLERLRLAGTGGDNDITAKRVKIITETLHVLDGYISQQERAMDTDALRDGRGWIEGEDGVGMSDYAEARETRLRFLTLQGQWLEMQGNMLVAESSSSSGADEEGRRHGATASFQGALASLEQATQLGDRLLASPSPSDQRSDAPDTGPIGSNPSSGKGRGSAKPQADIAAATGEAMLRLAKLCEGLAGGKVGGGGAGRDVEGAGARGREELAALAVKEYLRAMAVGSTSAMDRFPRVLVLAGEFPKARQAFADGAPAVPAWAFLRWVSQMLGVSGRKEGPVVIQVLERVALAYPRALFYPLLMTKASIKEGTSVGASGTSGNNDAQRLSKLTAITFDPSGEAFAEALRGLHHPELRFTDQMQHVLKLLVKGEKGLAQKAYRQMREDCLVIAGRKTGDEKVGTYNREFAKTRISKVDKSLGKGGEHMDARKIVAWIAEARKWTMKAKNDAASGRMKLSQFSGWMSDFDSNKHRLEVPGQYGGITAAPPQVSHHSRIVSFGSELLVMGSLRVPKRLTIHGDDERDHMFLVKGGEDLRVDQRVEQLFEVMNAVMAKSASCSRARLSNKTYKVVPVTPDIGLIEWVQNTRPLKSVIEQGLGVSKLWDLPATGTFLSFVGSSRHAYHDMFKKRGRHETETAFAKCCAAVPTDTLRQHLLAMAPSPEAFLTCRRGFARSLATLNACSYILGIGDRHLDNFLLDTSSGTVVGIDFGAAFGVGTTELPVPEMIPFRLTNQFQNLLQPLDSVGLLKGHMVSTLQALRGGSEVLLATMDVFLNEPVMEWISDGTQKRQKTTAKKGGDSGEEGGDPEIGEGEEGGGSSQPRPPSEAGRKIRNAERKLLGENPASVLIDDLEQNKKARAQGSLEKLKAIAWGRSGDRVRSKPENSAGLLSVEDQVECLIDLATDPDVLGRQYVGLATWI